MVDLRNRNTSLLPRRTDSPSAVSWTAKCAHYLWSWPRWNSKWPSWRSSTSFGRCTWSCPPRTRRVAAPRIRSVSGGPSVSTGPLPSAGCPSKVRPRSHASPASRRTCRTTRTRLPCNGKPHLPRRTWPPVSPVHWSPAMDRVRYKSASEWGDGKDLATLPTRYLINVFIFFFFINRKRKEKLYAQK